MLEKGIAEFDTSDLNEALRRSQAACEGLAKASLFMTGGSGFVGRWLLALLLHANSKLGLRATVAILTRDIAQFTARFPNLAGNPAVTLVEGDVRSFSFPSGAFSHVIHAAAELQTGDEASPLNPHDTTVGGTARVIEFCVLKGVKRLLFLSSGAVYGSQPENIPAISEDAEFSSDIPVSRYARAKRVAEQLVRDAFAGHELPAVTARIFSVVGPTMPMDAHFAIGNFIRDAVEGREIAVSGDGKAVRSYIYAADLAAWLIQILMRGRPGSAYNVGGDRALSISDLANLVAKTVPGSKNCVIQGASPSQQGRYVPSIQRARDELGLGVWTSLEDAIEKTARWASFNTNKL